MIAAPCGCTRTRICNQHSEAEHEDWLNGLAEAWAEIAAGRHVNAREDWR